MPPQLRKNERGRLSPSTLVMYCSEQPRDNPVFIHVDLLRGRDLG